MTAASALTIVKLLSVVDTREYHEVNERWVPISGSGTVATCERCGRGHEVHATVALADGSVAAVGTGCMDSDTLQKAARSAASSAATRRRLEAQRAQLVRDIATYERVWAEVNALTPPAAVQGTSSQGFDAVYVGDVCMHLTFRSILEATELATREWRRKRAQERGAPRSAPALARDLIQSIDRRLLKVRA